MSLVLGVRIVCDGPDCENPNSPGEICSTRIDSMDGWITREQNGAIHHFCESGCEMGWLTAMEPDPAIEEEEDQGVESEPPQRGTSGHDVTPRTCPVDGSRLVPILYGMPTLEAFEAAERGELVIGGCVIIAGDPEWPEFACSSSERHTYTADGRPASPLAKSLDHEHLNH
jgi:hypothetical protein